MTPLYTFRCDCGSTMNVRLPMSESTQPQPCECGSMAERTLSPDVLFQGLPTPGFHKTMSLPGGRRKTVQEIRDGAKQVEVTGGDE